MIRPRSPKRVISPLTPRQVWSLTGVNVKQKLFKKRDDELKQHIADASLSRYGEPSKQLQIEAVFNLVEGRNTFLLAGTGYGKSRIAEMYYKMIPDKKRAVVLVLNPLDTLGDNQVAEKRLAGFTAINLTKLTFNAQAAEDIKNGVYQFVYLSPEIFLNSKMFQMVYYSSEFQNRLALVVVDESHMIYIWGLVESGPAGKSISAHFRHEDYGIFRPSYGKLGPQLLFRNDAPLLLLSATCRPVAVEAIKKSLKLTDDNLVMLRGELTRPEIRIVRVPMANSLASSLDAVKVYPSQQDVPDDQMVPSLVYSGSRNRTMTVLEVIDRACETPGGAYVPNSTCARRFHSCTGDEDKVSCIDDFALGKFPVISCTMALGLGQNWKRVRMVVHMGRGDPASICQMVGRCGRDGKLGLAVLFMEKNRRGGKNHIDMFRCGAVQTDLDRMDALAITPLCLRVAFLLDNLLGYVPLWADDPSYIREVAREVAAGMPKCRCSNCAPVEAETLLECLTITNQDNFDMVMRDELAPPSKYNLKHKYPSRAAPVKKRKFTPADEAEIKEFTGLLLHDMIASYDNVVSPGGSVQGCDLFDEDDCVAILANLDNISDAPSLRNIVGGECFVGQLEWLHKWICDFRTSATHTQSIATQGPAASKKSRSTVLVTPKEALVVRKRVHIPGQPSKKAQAAETRRRVSLENQRKAEQAVHIKDACEHQLAEIVEASWAANAERLSREAP
ncbi:hypothetical protein MJO28_008214 [Puccinia striiformis f. sp. tritici]|uniref:Uncharacterized protein n=1 Tax=Puccinia striiformis f. sp. tritici TaxID=168172 RepID=A0ACC0EAE1_9BASI|nr:hypothetical protein MJO28_008214 [Puccinia striiformis f. sp. tritici]